MANAGSSWELVFGAGYIVPPCKGLDDEEVARHVVGSQFDIETLLSKYFLPIFSKDSENYPIGVGFISKNDPQENDIRALIRSVALENNDKKEFASRSLAFRLAQATTRRSKKPGLFVVLVGQNEVNHRVALWKFPADESIQAQITDQGISIRLIQDAFSGNSTYLKGAMFEGTAASTSFWRGRIEDRQTKSRIREMADFWVTDFLQSRPAMTDTSGTRLLSKGLRSVINQTRDIETQQSLIDAASVIKEQTGINISLNDFAQRYLPSTIRKKFISVIGGSELAQSIFRIDRETLVKEFKYKSIILENQFVLRGPLEQFDDVVHVGEPNEEGIVEITLQGRIASQAIKTR